MVKRCNDLSCDGLMMMMRHVEEHGQALLIIDHSDTGSVELVFPKLLKYALDRDNDSA